MALNKSVLKSNLKAVFSSRPQNDDEAAEKLAEVIFNFVASATVTTTVSGACETPSGPGTITGTGTGSLS